MNSETSTPNDSSKLDALFRLAVDQHRLGKIEEAEKLYRDVVERSPEHGAAHHNLGLIAFKRGDMANALSWYRAATIAQPGKEQYRHSYIDALIAANRFAEAEQAIAEARSAGHDTAAVGALADRLQALAANAARAARSIEGSDPEAYVAPLIDLINRGQFADAELLARQAVSAHPDFGVGWKLLGVAQQMNGAPSIGAMRRAAELLPDDPDTHLNLGAALFSADDLAGAEAAFRNALAIDPNIPEGQTNLGVTLERLGRIKEAREPYRMAAELSPGERATHMRHAQACRACGDIKASIDAYRRAEALGGLPDDAFLSMATALVANGEIEEAFPYFRRALAESKPDAEIHRHFGDALLAANRLSEAEAEFRNALMMKPDLFTAQLNLGTCLDRQGRVEDAIRAFRRASQIDPDSALSHANQSASHFRLGQFDEAVAEARQAIKRDPRMSAAHLNLGGALIETRDYPGALAALEEALRLRPDYARAHRNIGDILVEYGEVAEGIGHFRRAIEIEGESASVAQSLIFAQHYLPETHRRDAHDLETGRFAAQLRARIEPYREWPRTRAGKRKLRVGLVSGDLFQHPVGLFLEGAIRDFDADDIEFFAYYNHHRRDALNSRLRALIPQWRDIVNKPDEEVADLVRKDEIDILVDLAGHGSRNRLSLFVRKPAPVQASWLGYFATTGLDEIDYFITDPVVLPDGAEAELVERPKRLPDCFLCLAPPDLEIDVAPPPVRLNGHFTFGSFNFSSKINDEVIAVWARILNAVPGSRLFLKSGPLGFPAAAERIVSGFAKHGVASDRLIIEPSSARPEYFQAHNRVDLCLDPFPYTGGTTTIDALWMGVPTLTLRGDSLIGRQGESILRNVDLADFVTRDKDAYAARAIELATKPQMLADLRSVLRDRLLASPLCDSAKYGAALAGLFREMWRERGLRG